MLAFPLRVYDLAVAAEILGFFATSPIMPAQSLQKSPSPQTLALLRSLPQNELPPAETTPGDHFRHRKREFAPIAAFFTPLESGGAKLAVETAIDAKGSSCRNCYSDLI